MLLYHVQVLAGENGRLQNSGRSQIQTPEEYLVGVSYYPEKGHEDIFGIKAQGLAHSSCVHHEFPVGTHRNLGKAGCSAGNVHVEIVEYVNRRCSFGGKGRRGKIVPAEGQKGACLPSLGIHALPAEYEPFKPPGENHLAVFRKPAGVKTHESRAHL